MFTFFDESAISSKWQIKLDQDLPKAFYDDFVQTGLAHCNLDAMPKTPSHATLNVDISDGIEKEQHHNTDISIYTDGSKIDEPEQWGTGAGYLIMSKQETFVNSHVTLCHTKTVFQAEIIAIHVSLKAFVQQVQLGRIPPRASVTVFTDSQSALKALSSTYVTSKTVQECIQYIQQVSEEHHINFVWVRAHNNNQGNERADALAKEGARTPRPVSGPGPFHYVPPSFIKAQLLLYALKEWNKWWQTHQPCRQTKEFFKEVDLKRSKQILKHNRQDIGLLLRWLTGHNFTRYHRSLLDPTGRTPSTCRLCHSDRESAVHLLLHCPALDTERRSILRIEECEKVTDISIAHILDYLHAFADLFEKDSENPSPDNTHTDATPSSPSSPSSL